MKSRFLACSVAAVCCIPAARAVDNLLVIGDSLSKEYRVTITGIGGSSQAVGIRNWCEILDQRRNSFFDMGGFGTQSDLRAPLGHQYNFSVPGSFADDWASDYLPATGFRRILYGIDHLEGYIDDDVNRVVIMLGGNDVRDNYGDLYTGALNGNTWADRTYADLEYIVNWVKAIKPSMKMVLVGLLHVGCTPRKNRDHPYDVVKTGRVTSALTRLNNKLATLATQKNIGYCGDLFEITKRLLTTDYLCLGGVPIYKNPPNEDGEPRYLFLGDGFHPNEPTQAIIAQRIVDCFNTKYGSNIPRLTNSEILVDILGLRTDQVFDDWIKNYGVPSGSRGTAADPDADGTKNLMEFALDLDPTVKDRHLLPKPTLTTQSGQTFATLTWTPRLQECQLVSLVPQQSSNLTTWTDVPSANITQNANRSVTVRIPLTGGAKVFLRLKATMLSP